VEERFTVYQGERIIDMIKQLNIEQLKHGEKLKNIDINLGRMKV